MLLGDALGLGSSRIWVVLKNQHIVGSVESTMPKRKKKKCKYKYKCIFSQYERLNRINSFFFEIFPTLHKILAFEATYQNSSFSWILSPLCSVESTVPNPREKVVEQTSGVCKHANERQSDTGLVCIAFESH